MMAKSGATERDWAFGPSALLRWQVTSDLFTNLLGKQAEIAGSKAFDRDRLLDGDFNKPRP